MLGRNKSVALSQTMDRPRSSPSGELRPHRRDVQLRACRWGWRCVGNKEVAHGNSAQALSPGL